MKYRVMQVVRRQGAIGLFSSPVREFEAATPQEARDQSFAAWHAEGFETAGFGVYDPETGKCLLGGDSFQ